MKHQERYFDEKYSDFFILLSDIKIFHFHSFYFYDIIKTLFALFEEFCAKKRKYTDGVKELALRN